MPLACFPRQSKKKADGTIKSWTATRCQACYRKHRAKRERIYKQGLDQTSVGYAVDIELPPVTEKELTLKVLAACKGDSRFVSMDLTGAVRTPGRATAKKVLPLLETCDECQVKKLCREVCDTIEESQRGNGKDPRFVVGIWGGELPAERMRRRKERDAQQAA